MSWMIDADEILKELTCDFTGKQFHGNRKVTIGECRRIIENAHTITQPNEPLTLEELREMDEIPIYVVTEKYGSGWCVLNWHGVKKSYTYFSRTGTSEGMTATPLFLACMRDWNTVGALKMHCLRHRRKGGLHDERAKNPGHE